MLPSQHLQIVGAGPAGLAAALTARTAGVPVTIYEKHARAGSRFHDDFQGLENWTTEEDVLGELNRLGLTLSFEPPAVREIVCFDSLGAPLHLRSRERPLFYLIKRGQADDSLDTALARQALAAGATVRWSTRVEHLHERGIVAEGPHEADVIAVGYTFTTEMADGYFVALSDSLAPAGYAYLLVHRGCGTVAACMYRDFHAEKHYLERTVDFFRHAAGLSWIQARAFGGSGNMRAQPILRTGELLHAGECAGLQDPLFGFGLRYALLSGHFAAQAWLAGSSELYERLWRKRIREFMRTGRLNRWFYALLGDRGRGLLLAHAVAGRDPRKILSRIYRPGSIKALLGALAAPSRAPRDPKPGCDCTWCRCHAVECT